MSDLQDLVTRVFTHQVGHDRVVEAEQTSLLTDLWGKVAEVGLPWIGIDETAGGQGGSLEDLLTVLHASGQHAVPLPLLETHLAAWLVTASGGQVDDTAPWSVAPPQDGLAVADGRASGTLRDVAWGGSVERVVAVVGDQVVILDPTTSQVVAGRDIAGQPRDALSFEDAPAQVLTSAVSADQLAQRGAALRALQMAGAMQAVYDITDRYVYEREQFGRPVGTFQAVRRHLVFLAQMAVMTRVSAERAAAALESGEDASFAAAAAKLVANQNAAVSIASGHQAHGAIGMTREYALQDYTRRLNAWRGDWGTELALAERIGEAALAAGELARLATDQGALTL
jgi:acyl-CoA dehydrogenase